MRTVRHNSNSISKSHFWMKPMYEIFAKETLVGRSRLEFGDPPMGVAFGEFLPELGYSEIEHECRINHQDQTHLGLNVRTATGEKIPCVGVGILDYSSEIDDGYAEVNLLGVEYSLYAQLFPDQVYGYEQKFKS